MIASYFCGVGIGIGMILPIMALEAQLSSKWNKFQFQIHTLHEWNEASLCQLAILFKFTAVINLATCLLPKLV